MGLQPIFIFCCVRCTGDDALFTYRYLTINIDRYLHLSMFFCNYSGRGQRTSPTTTCNCSGVLNICAVRPVNYSDSYVNQA